MSAVTRDRAEAGSLKPLAVFDFGKTNAKLVVFAADGSILSVARTHPSWLEEGTVRVLDVDRLWAWVEAELGRAFDAHGIGGVMVSAHGCGCALLGPEGLARPILDYESELGPAVDAAFAAVSPLFSETYSPPLPGGQNHAKQIFYYEQAEGGLSGVDTVLSLPQFWNWKLSGVRVSELTYFGSHSHLWAPGKRDFSSLVDARGWRRLFPAFSPAGAVIGRYRATSPAGRPIDIAVHNGMHDSNAALAFCRAVALGPVTLVSTGTWVITMNPDCPLSALDPHRDMLANVDPSGAPVATIRFMGGREYDRLAEGATFAPADAIERMIAARRFALPSFAPGGPYVGRKGRFEGGTPEGEEKAALALLYVVMMTNRVLDLVGSKGTIVADGGLVANPLYAGMVAQLRPGRAVRKSGQPEGTAAGAASVAFAALGHRPFTDTSGGVAATRFAGLEDYYRDWLRRAEEDAAPAPQPGMHASEKGALQAGR